MVKVTFSPIKELIVHEVVEIGKEDLLRDRVTPNGTMPLYWCDGILFSFTSLPMSDELLKDYIGGVIHWGEVHYMKYDKFTPTVSFTDEYYKTDMNVRVLDTSKLALHKDFIKALKAKM